MRNFKQIFITWLMVLMAMSLTAQRAADGVLEARRVILTATDQSKQAAHAVSHTLFPSMFES